jgi:hypothetical protein
MRTVDPSALAVRAFMGSQMDAALGQTIRQRLAGMFPNGVTINRAAWPRAEAWVQCP